MGLRSIPASVEFLYRYSPQPVPTFLLAPYGSGSTGLLPYGQIIGVTISSSHDQRGS